MQSLISIYSAICRALGQTRQIWPELARFSFAAVLLIYFWHSATLKLGPGITGLFAPSSGAYVQILPKMMEAAGYNSGALPWWSHLVVIGGTWAEFILPLLLVLGLFTRLVALGMIGFVVVQSLTDLYGHGGIAHAETLGAWFDRFNESPILDQRLLWVVILMGIVAYGPGRLSLDRMLKIESK